MSTLDQLSRAALDRAPESQALEYEHRWFSWGELRGIGDEVARLLAKAGVAERQTVAFVPRNRPSACAAELGMIAARYSISMIYAFQAAAGIARDVGKVGAAAVVAGEDDFTPELLAVVAEQGLAAIALGETSARVIEGAARSTAAGVAPTPEPQIAVHTSGTTGAPKNVGFTYDTIARYMVGQNVASAAASGTIDETTPPTLLTFPLGNISGIYGLLPTLLGGKRAVLLDRFTLDHWRDFVRRYQPPMPILPPAAITMVLDADIPPEELSCITMIMTGAAPLDPTVQQRFQDRYNVPILLSYGATEFGGPVTLMTPEDYKQFGVAKIGTVGRPFAGAQLRAINAETGDILPAGEEGLLEVVAPRIGDHWIRTTDIGMIDADGFLFLRGRADGAIVRGGFKLLPETIERALLLHPAVVSVAVVGVADKRLGQVPAAAIQIKSGMTEPSIAELDKHLRQHVYATHVPTMWKFVDAIPKNKSLKTDAAAVRALFE
ncbi:class I adenylate-forming enzyme family protein [Sphingomonas sp. SUN039]|uniref:class I adenylate-forming enzyme family protein n=1 Tax=Sphingomonas sp. SUN039 TaxID=2937787 RepID=UPI00216452AB|nr:fatty acid--CoA ligase family protein [Sphingomonas sp. SUN039]UVO53633.1 fatty acid--CoA ligase family protein [Sphingomonas sp. SUN039]